MRGNTTELGGGISLPTLPAHGIEPTVTLNDSSSVRGNAAANAGGGFFFNEGTVTLKDSSSVSGPRANDGGGIWSSAGAPSP